MSRWAFLPLMATQGLWTACRTPRLPPAVGPVDGLAHGEGALGDESGAASLLALGDSIIAGVGVENTREALPAQLAEALAQRLRRPVSWTARGLNGARSSWLLGQLPALKDQGVTPDVVIVSNGINEITTTRTEAQILERMESAILGLAEAFPGALIGQLGLPPLGVFPALPQPLRRVLGRRSDRIDSALHQWLDNHARVCYLRFDQHPEPEHFAIDGYHPAAEAVALWAGLVADELVDLLADSVTDSRGGDA